MRWNLWTIWCSANCPSLNWPSTSRRKKGYATSSLYQLCYCVCLCAIQAVVHMLRFIPFRPVLLWELWESPNIFTRRGKLLEVRWVVALFSVRSFDRPLLIQPQHACAFRWCGYSKVNLTRWRQRRRERFLFPKGRPTVLASYFSQVSVLFRYTMVCRLDLDVHMGEEWAETPSESSEDETEKHFGQPKVGGGTRHCFSFFSIEWMNDEWEEGRGGRFPNAYFQKVKMWVTARSQTCLGSGPQWVLFIWSSASVRIGWGTSSRSGLQEETQTQ